MIAEIGNGVHMSDKAEGFAVFQTFCGRKMSINIAVLIQCYIRDTKSFQFLYKDMRQIKLTLGRRGRSALFVAWCEYFYIG